MQYSNIAGSAFTDDAGNYFTDLVILNSAAQESKLCSHLKRQDLLTRMYARVIMFAVVLKELLFSNYGIIHSVQLTYIGYMFSYTFH
jgi:hypothetical protein